MKWEREPEFTTANRAERCRVGDYELVAFDLPAGRAGPREVRHRITHVEKAELKNGSDGTTKTRLVVGVYRLR